jgi:DNA-binding NarL/FixJ family response regulator
LMMSAKVLLVDDHALIRSGLRTLLEEEEGRMARMTDPNTQGCSCTLRRTSIAVCCLRPEASNSALSSKGHRQAKH